MSSAGADPRPTLVRFADQGLTVTIPAGFQRQPAEDPAPALLGTWRRDNGTDGPVVLQLVALRAVVAQRPPTEADLDAWRASDPMPFVDRVVTARALDLSLHALEGEGTARGHAMVRLATVLPMAGEGVRVFVMATDARRDEARRVFHAVLASARGPAAWATTAELRRLAALRAVVATAVVLMLAYAVAAVAVFRRHDGWRAARAGVMFAVAGLWGAAAGLVPWGQWCAVAQALALAAAFARQGMKLRAR